MDNIENTEEIVTEEALNETTESPVLPEEEKSVDIFSACEAMLFAAGEPVTAARMAAAIDVAEREVIAELDSRKDEISGGIELIKLGNAYQLTAREEYGDCVRDILGIKKNGAISKSSLEALAIIAYNQPTTKAYVEKVRGVDSSYAFGFLMSRQLIEQCGRLDAPGRPILYKTTPDFLRVFGLSDLEELPYVDNEEPAAEQITLDVSGEKTEETENPENAENENTENSENENNEIVENAEEKTEPAEEESGETAEEGSENEE